ncbi:MAG: peptidase M14, partial [Mesorhizobium sp.]
MLGEVKQGDLIGILHPMDSSSANSSDIRSPGPSIVCGVRSGGYVEVGEWLALLARPLNR